MIKGRWSNNTGEMNVDWDQIEIFNISNGPENIDPSIFFSKLRQVQELEGMTSR